eukprot:TRINITY_DN16978_c1_g3_i1.p1 TRINITY_DN16978_c1_g3~~TRINITY_DN16978_c1_g3_i1.p1  ORF type:complete len:125 (-),score=18.43 TRINITY_DN16978_c1_g3_i1:283-657(-)
MSKIMKINVQIKAPASARIVLVRPPRRESVTIAMASQESRRTLFAGLLASGVLMTVQKSDAFVVPSQESTGGLGRGGGSLPKSTTAASMSSYSMEGTKKRGISPKRKAQLLAKVKQQATSASQS